MNTHQARPGPAHGPRHQGRNPSPKSRNVSSLAPRRRTARPSPRSSRSPATAPAHPPLRRPAGGGAGWRGGGLGLHCPADRGDPAAARANPLRSVRGGADDRRIPGPDGPLADDGGTDLITAAPLRGDQFPTNRDNAIVHKPDFWGLLGEADRKDLIAMARSRVFPPAGILCTQGEPTTHVFILQSGWVKILTDTSDGRRTLEALRRPGEIVGEIAGQVTGYRTATVQALGTVHALSRGPATWRFPGLPPGRRAGLPAGHG